jgi:DNA invertase Pin-like site-specific DNA recombinase
MKEFKNAIGYIRVSTEGQFGDDRYGADNQKKEILAYANTNGYNVVDWFMDVESGAKDDRPEMDKILYGENITNPPFEAVIAFKNDRVARSTKLYFYYLYTLEKRNIKLLCADEKFAEGDDFANIYRSLLQFVAEQERKNIALRTSGGRKIKAMNGGYSGGRAPYGYEIKNGQYSVVEAEAEMVRIVFDMLDSGSTLQDVADKLNALGYISRKGKTFQASQIRSIRNNRQVYEGKYKYGDMGYVNGVHEPILKEDV